MYRETSRDFVTGDKQRRRHISDQVLVRYGFLSSLLVELFRENHQTYNEIAVQSENVLKFVYEQDVDGDDKHFLYQ